MRLLVILAGLFGLLWEGGPPAAAQFAPIGVGPQQTGGGISCSGAGLTAYNNVVSNLGGTLDTAHQQAYKALICGPSGLETTGELTGTLASGGNNCGSLIDIFYVLGTDTAAHALTNICGNTSYNAVAHGSPTFTANGGYTGVAASTTVYIDTGYNASTAGINYTLNSADVLAFSLTSLAGNANQPFGSVSGTPGNVTGPNPIFTDGKYYCAINDLGNDPGNTFSGTTQGIFACNRSASGAEQAYYCNSSGCSLDHSPNQTSTIVPANDIEIVAVSHITGTSFLGWGGEVSALAAGGSMTATNLTHIHAALCAFQTQLSASWAGC